MSTEPNPDKKPVEFRTMSMRFILWLYVFALIAIHALGSSTALIQLIQGGSSVEAQMVIHSAALIGALIGMIGLAATKEFRSKMYRKRKIEL